MKKHGSEIKPGDTINQLGMWFKIESIENQTQREILYTYKENGEKKTGSFRKEIIYSVK